MVSSTRILNSTLIDIGELTLCQELLHGGSVLYVLLFMPLFNSKRHSLIFCLIKNSQNILIISYWDQLGHGSMPWDLDSISISFTDCQNICALWLKDIGKERMTNITSGTMIHSTLICSLMKKIWDISTLDIQMPRSYQMHLLDGIL